jgi:hypothetical protein
MPSVSARIRIAVATDLLPSNDNLPSGSCEHGEAKALRPFWARNERRSLQFR